MSEEPAEDDQLVDTQRSRSRLDGGYGRLRHAQRLCQAGLRKCVCYWVGATAGTQVTRDPDHLAGVGGYTVAGSWVTSFFLELADRHETTLAQVHTHPGRSVIQSPTDDQFVLVPSPGFLSLIVPHFGLGTGHHLWGAWRLERDGTWADGTDEVRWTIA